MKKFGSMHCKHKVCLRESALLLISVMQSAAASLHFRTLRTVQCYFHSTVVVSVQQDTQVSAGIPNLVRLHVLIDLAAHHLGPGGKERQAFHELL